MFKGIDRFLATILGVVFLIIVVAVVLVWRSPTEIDLEYSAGNEPNNVVHNYIVAITKGDEQRAKSYLSSEVLEEVSEREGDGYSLVRPRSGSRDSGIRIVVELEGIEDGLATVSVDITHFYSSASPIGLFAVFDDNQWTSTHTVRLRQFGGEWLIVKPFAYYMVS